LPAGGFADRDESPRREPPPEHLSRYQAAFAPAGTVTVGNAAAVGDGAAAALVSSKTAAGAPWQPLARIVSATGVAADPGEPALAVLPAVETALERAGLDARAVGRWEINEAFAVKVLACIREFGLETARVNVNGGAIAYGHPFAASGAILLVHLAAELARSGERYGLAAIAGAGGIGEAVIVERLC
jgi:acetyl-CoA acetyltransferase family protein